MVLRDFMSRHFGTEYVACIDTKMTGPYSARKLSDTAHVQFFNREARDRVFGTIKERKLGEGLKSSSGNALKIDKMKTDWQSARNWAMWKAEALVKEKLRSDGSAANPRYEATKDARKLTVDGQDGFI